MPNLRLIQAEVLKLRRRRGMLAVAVGLTLGLMAVAYLVTAIQHGGNPGKYGPAGGLKGFEDSLAFLSVVGFVMAAIIGSTAGSQDIDTGVFRDLAATGRSRTALFLARVGGAWVVVLSILAVTLALDVAGAFAFADGTATPGAGDIGQAVAMTLAAGALGAALAVGLAALFGSRGPVIGILIAAHVVFEPQLQGAGFLGDARKAIPVSAIDRIGDHASSGMDYKLALGTAVAVVAAWIAAALVAGAWRTKSREI
ncbi:MAG: type transport system permease protein [Solirubrobacteraceae bacterium]|jgi:ABC-type transport system involved in multi-copper enzyme maturation permease subunit|nr:type transport system permease protein [Solirubrobacteraceae bacterium]